MIFERSEKFTQSTLAHANNLDIDSAVILKQLRYAGSASVRRVLNHFDGQELF